MTVASDRQNLTCVAETSQENLFNYQLLFGNPTQKTPVMQTFGKRSSRAYFAPGSIFCLDLWHANRAGRTLRWKTYVLQAGAPGDVLTRVPQVTPGALVLMEAKGARRCKFLLKWLAALAERCDPATLPADYFVGRDLWMQGLIPERSDPAMLD